MRVRACARAGGPAGVRVPLRTRATVHCDTLEGMRVREQLSREWRRAWQHASLLQMTLRAGSYTHRTLVSAVLSSEQWTTKISASARALLPR